MSAAQRLGRRGRLHRLRETGQVPVAGQVGPVVVGGGLAGASVALELANRGVATTLVTAGSLGNECASDWAQGGLAAALDAHDDPAQHAQDTVAAGAGLCDPMVVDAVTQAAPAVIERLVALGAQLSRDGDGQVELGLEGGHHQRRIVHAGGDRSGHVFTQAVVRAVRGHRLITVREGLRAVRILVADGRVVGLLATSLGRASGFSGAGGQLVALASSALVLATGGAGALYGATTNPTGSFGSGLAMGLRAGARLRDPELVQFHPTALDVGGDPMPLVSEAVRGEGAHLVLRDGTRILDDDLATRDVVSRAVYAHTSAGRAVFLDLPPILARRFDSGFPTVNAACVRAGVDPAAGRLPIRPAAHYHMGGLLVDRLGATTVPGLWACGEVASTGLHGANRLASNSLLEAMACAPSIAEAIEQATSPAHGQAISARAQRHEPIQQAAHAAARLVDMLPPRTGAPARASAHTQLRAMMDRDVGVIRCADRLHAAVQQLAPDCLGDDARLVAVLIAAGALARQESRGAHFRSDAPQTGAGQHTVFTLEHARSLSQAERYAS